MNSLRDKIEDAWEDAKLGWKDIYASKFERIYIDCLLDKADNLIKSCDDFERESNDIFREMKDLEE